MVLPLVGMARTRGALVVGRLQGRRLFTSADLEMATTFANHAALALELADARSDRERVALLEDRDRIARDLHDHVIQRLFGAGLTVESIASGLGNDARVGRLSQVVDDIDETIRQIRTSIFRLRGPIAPGAGAVRGQHAGRRRGAELRCWVSSRGSASPVRSTRPCRSRSSTMWLRCCGRG